MLYIHNIYLPVIYIVIFLLKAQKQPFSVCSNFDIFENRNMLYEVHHFLEIDV